VCDQLLPLVLDRLLNVPTYHFISDSIGITQTTKIKHSTDVKNPYEYTFTTWCSKKATPSLSRTPTSIA
jgi:hypothetical protein